MPKFRYNKIYSDTNNNEFIEGDIFVTLVHLKIFKESNVPLNERQKIILY